jgi:hypothetical protein
MALIDRVKERFKPELGDPELQELIAEADAEIVRRYGLAAGDESGDESITVTFAGGSSSLFPARPISNAQDVEVVEIDGDIEIELDPSDYRLWHNGRRVERLGTGPNARTRWASLVEITYVPSNNTLQRDEVILKLVKLSLDYEGVTRDSIDGYSTTFADFTKERESLLASLAPSRVRMA